MGSDKFQMRYFIIANNKKLSQHIIDQVQPDEKDIIVLFNDMYAFYYDSIKKHPRKWFIGRQLPFKQDMPFRSFAGLDEVKEYERFFEKIIVHSCPCVFDQNKNRTQKFLQERLDCYNFDPNKLDCLEPESDGVRKLIGYPKGKNMSSGVIAYNAIHRIKKPEDEVVLVAFTSELTKSFHNDTWEAQFFQNEIKQNRCTSIGGYSLEQEKYETIYNKIKWKSYMKGNHGAESLEIVKKINPNSILDVGCGPNLFCKQTINDLCLCQGLDFAGKWQDIDADLCSELLYVRDDQYDLVTAFDTMEHLLLSCIDTTLSEMQRISKNFLMQIDYNRKSTLIVHGSSLHPTVKSKKWWHEQILNYANEIREEGRYIYGSWKK